MGVLEYMEEEKLRRAHNPGNPRHSRGTHCPGAPGGDTSDSSDTGSNKAPATMEAQVQQGHQVTFLAEAMEGRKCR